MRSTTLTALTLIVSATISPAGNTQEKAEIDAVARVFAAEDVAGTIVVVSADGSTRYVHNDARSNTRFSPASTFKMPNTLIALDAGVVASANSTFKWDGKERGLAAWNRDQTLRSAFQVSCVWCYQEIARTVGNDRYAGALAAIDYGNQRLGDHVDQFWLNGDLQISANEQIAFLRKIFDQSLPFQRKHLDTLKAIMLIEQTADYALFAKTGWTGAELYVGWYVGYVEKSDKTWLFAMNMRMDSAEQAALRKDLTMRSLRALGVL